MISSLLVKDKMTSLDGVLRDLEAQRAHGAMVDERERALELGLARRTDMQRAEIFEKIRELDLEDAQQRNGINANLNANLSLRGRGKEARKTWDKDKASRAHRRVRDIDRAVSNWFRFYNGYSPLFSWWVKRPAGRVNEALNNYGRLIKDQLVDRANKKPQGPDGLVGDPIGSEKLLEELKREMIAYTPAELVRIARQEFAWCDREMAKASRELGYGDDWRKAQDYVKNLHVKPGEQPKLIKQLALEAESFLEERKLLTIPPLCKETWRIQMMSADRQRVNPYFTGGEVISVSFPTDEMAHKDKLMSMRGNNIHFSRATVHHELIPGHHLQGFMTARYRSYRRRFNTPFWTEGWALYWETVSYTHLTLPTSDLV